MDLELLVATMARTGSAWVLWVLLGCSVLSIAIILDRVLYWVGSAYRDARGGDSPQRRVARVAAAHRSEGAQRLRAAIHGQRLQERAEAERGLVILGTLGNNAPFIGLFGTVLGIVRAFHDLGTSASQGPSAVMAGISEALVATAIGILVAIPAVVAYNLLQRRVRVLDYLLEGLTERVVADADVSPGGSAVAAASPSEPRVAHALGD